MANIIIPTYHLVWVADRIVGIDHLVDGKNRWGLSLGYRESELVTFGVDMDQRVGRYIKEVNNINKLLEGERCDFDGDQFNY